MSEPIEKTVERLCAGTRWTVHEVKAGMVAFLDQQNGSLVCFALVSGHQDEWERVVREHLSRAELKAMYPARRARRA